MADDTGRETRDVPLVLVDGGDDGLEEQGWVEKTVGAARARELMQVYNPDPELCVIKRDGTAFLRPDDPDAPEDRQSWQPCSPNAEGAREFWTFLAVDRA